MRAIFKLFLLVVVALIMCFCYKFIIISGGIKTVLSEASREFDNYSAIEQLAVVADIEEDIHIKLSVNEFILSKRKVTAL